MARVGPELAEKLTPREREVLELLRLGLTNGEIAKRLQISPAGAKYHVSEIIGKLGVRSRYEASAWPERPPWWLGALAPIGLLVRQVRTSWMAAVIATGASAAVAAAIGVLIWGLVRTNDSSPSPHASTTDTISSIAPPIETPEPYAGAPVDCPAGFATPEQAVEACYELREGEIFIGDCDTPIAAPPGQGLDRPCTIWEDGSGDLRSYQVSGIGADGYLRYTVQLSQEGWIAIQRSVCSVQNDADYRSFRELQHIDISQVFFDECVYPPPPMPRPTLHVGPRVGASVKNGRTDLRVIGGSYYPGRGIKLGLSINNVSGGTLPWTSDVGARIELVAQDGTSYAPSEVGGTTARSIAEGIAKDAAFNGWLVFPTEAFGTYTLRYPGQADIVLELTPDAFRAPLPNPKGENN